MGIAPKKIFMKKKVFVLFSTALFFFSCQQTTSYQVVLYNNANAELKVKLYSPLNLQKDSFVVAAFGQVEVFYKKEKGLNSTYDCASAMDSVMTYSDSHKMKVKLNSAHWKYDNNAAYLQEEHRCTLWIGNGDTIQ